MKQTAPPKLFIAARESVCDECGEELGRKASIMLAGDRGALPGTWCGSSRITPIMAQQPQMRQRRRAEWRFWLLLPLLCVLVSPLFGASPAKTAFDYSECLFERPKTLSVHLVNIDHDSGTVECGGGDNPPNHITSVTYPTLPPPTTKIPNFRHFP